MKELLSNGCALVMPVIELISGRESTCEPKARPLNW